jgi:hypothetical protein
MPPATQTATICIYKILKSAAGISDVDVYVQGHSDPLIVYQFPYSGHIEHTAIVVGLRQDGRFVYSGAIGAGNNPIDVLAPEISVKCNAESGFTDQVFFWDGADRVDMSGY